MMVTVANRAIEAGHRLRPPKFTTPTIWVLEAGSKQWHAARGVASLYIVDTVCGRSVRTAGYSTRSPLEAQREACSTCVEKLTGGGQCAPR
jgi:hypothetical protein